MARKELAGLAALGALAMMANRSKKGADRDTVPGTNIPIAGGESEAETFPNEYRYKVEKDFGGSSGTGDYAPGPSSMMRREPTARTSSTLRPAATASTASGSSRTKPMTGSGGGRGPAAGEAEAYRKSMNRVPSLDTSKVSDVDLTGGAKATNTNMPSSGLKYQSLQDREIEAQAKRRAAGSSFYGTKTMAKGGMARSSASSRADGIASRGKTRGKVC